MIQALNSRPYPYRFLADQSQAGECDVNTRPRQLPNVKAAHLRALIQEASRDPETIVALALSYDTLSSKLVEQAGFPALFMSGFNVAASLGLPDTGYIAFQEMAQRIQETSREVSLPIIADADTGYGSPMNVRRTVRG